MSTSKPPPRRMTLDEWQAEGLRLFGPRHRDWRFVCVKCGHVQSGTEASIRNPSLTMEFLSDRIYFACEGRWTKGIGCDWSLGGLFTIHRLEVVTPSGDVRPVFEFDYSGGPALVPVESAPALTEASP